jgi:two-component system, CitB family, response regulator MalR
MRRLNNILIIDDDEVNNIFCSIVIEHLDISDAIHCCTNGLEALEYLESCIVSSRPAPELILLDINMPLMNGLEFLEKYHELNFQEKLGSKISILSSSDITSDIDTTCQYDCVVDYIIKPLSEAALKRVLEKVN